MGSEHCAGFRRRSGCPMQAIDNPGLAEVGKEVQAKLRRVVNGARCLSLPLWSQKLTLQWRWIRFVPLARAWGR